MKAKQNKRNKLRAGAGSKTKITSGVQRVEELFHYSKKISTPPKSTTSYSHVGEAKTTTSSHADETKNASMELHTSNSISVLNNTRKPYLLCRHIWINIYSYLIIGERNDFWKIGISPFWVYTSRSFRDIIKLNYTINSCIPPRLNFGLSPEYIPRYTYFPDNITFVDKRFRYSRKVHYLPHVQWMLNKTRIKSKSSNTRRLNVRYLGSVYSSLDKIIQNQKKNNKRKMSLVDEQDLVDQQEILVSEFSESKKNKESTDEDAQIYVKNYQKKINKKNVGNKTERKKKINKKPKRVNKWSTNIEKKKRDKKKRKKEKIEKDVYLLSKYHANFYDYYSYDCSSYDCCSNRYKCIYDNDYYNYCGNYYLDDGDEW